MSFKNHETIACFSEVPIDKFAILDSITHEEY